MGIVWEDDTLVLEIKNLKRKNHFNLKLIKKQF